MLIGINYRSKIRFVVKTSFFPIYSQQVLKFSDDKGKKLIKVKETVKVRNGFTPFYSN